MRIKLTTVIEKDRDGYYATCPELKGCQSEGESLHEVVAGIHEAIVLYISDMSSEEIMNLRY